DWGGAIALDAAGNAYVAGGTLSGDFPARVGPDLSFNGGGDGFVAKVTSSVCTISGTSESDALTGTAGADVLCGRGGDDTLHGLGGDDVVIGWWGHDVLDGGTGGDREYGGNGNGAFG